MADSTLRIKSSISGQTKQKHEAIIDKRRIIRAYWSTLKAKVGEKVGMFVDVTGFPDGTKVTFSVYEHYRLQDEDHDLKKDDIQGEVKDGLAQAEWEFQYVKDEADVRTELAEDKKYTVPEYFFRVKVQEVEGECKERLEYRDRIEIFFVGPDGKAVSNEEYLIEFLATLKKRKGKLDEKGRLYEENVPIGNYSIELLSGVITEVIAGRIKKIKAELNIMSGEETEYCTKIESKTAHTEEKKVCVTPFPFYMDVGAWIGREDGTGNFQTFGLVSGNSLLVGCFNECNEYEWKLDEGEGHGDVLHWKKLMDGLIADHYPEIFKGDVKRMEESGCWEFLKKISNARGDKDPRLHILFHAYNTIEGLELWPKKGLLIIIPDLHLHFFKNTCWDNFIEVRNRERYSLEKNFLTFLNCIQQFKEDGGSPVLVVQVGDLYEIWESQYLIDKLKEVQHVKNWAEEIAKLWDLDFDKYIYEDIDIKNRIMSGEGKLGFSVIFKKISQLKERGIEFVYALGNHDADLHKTDKDKELYGGDPKKYSEKLLGRWKDQAGGMYMHLEHGHFIDDPNCKNESLGRIVTKTLTNFEEFGLGDWARDKATPLQSLWDRFRGEEELTRKSWKKYSINLWKKYEYKLHLFVMGHTHKPYLTMLCPPGMSQVCYYDRVYEFNQLVGK